MASCEKCWGDAFLRSMYSSKDQADCYSELMKERLENPCSPEEQAGREATECTACGRRTVHQYAGICMNIKCKTS